MIFARFPLEWETTAYVSLVLCRVKKKAVRWAEYILAGELEFVAIRNA